MKTILALAVLALAFSSPSMADEKKKPAPRQMSSFDELDAAGIGVGYQRPNLAAGERFIADLKPAEPPPKRELGPIDRWRYDSCRTEASKAPTKEGVRAGLQVCHEKFGQ